MNMTLIQLASKALQNKHTTGAAVIYAFAKWGCPLISTWFPTHKAQLDTTATILEGMAVFYGFAAAGDASAKPTPPPAPPAPEPPVANPQPAK